MTYRVILTGSRRWTDRTAIHAVLRELDNNHADLLVIHGACPTGADAIADAFAESWGIARKPMPADWDSCAPTCPARPHRKTRRPGDIHHPGTLPDYCPGAGPRRNWAMCQTGADLAVAWSMDYAWGTANCINAARDSGITVHKYGPGRSVPTVLRPRGRAAA